MSSTDISDVYFLMFWIFFYLKGTAYTAALLLSIADNFLFYISLLISKVQVFSLDLAMADQKGSGKTLPHPLKISSRPFFYELIQL